ncbi:hypothetical protein SNE40_010096 [Patella caerulea]|uniref:Ionotropic glutamate receptor C-terminal domain-containing protein n=1 Tax=Patella caerulea TaxID=87958 RepID=A0AAN8K092_PATCE
MSIIFPVCTHEGDRMHFVNRTTLFEREYSTKHPRILELISTISDIMSWIRLVIIYDSHGLNLLWDFYDSVETKYTPAAFFDVQDWKGQETSLLLMIHKQYFPNISIILFGGHDVLNILAIANRLDARSNRTTDFSHKSFWIFVPGDDDTCVFSVLDTRQIVLENIAIISCFESSVGVFTFTLSSRRFVLVDTYTKSTLFPNGVYGFNGRHFIITSHVAPQFFLKHNDSGNITYSGYAKTFCDAMSTFLNFTYSFVEPEDNQWGNLINGSWDGLVAQLMRREVDMAVAELTLTPDRETVVDFILPPFFTQGLGMVFRKEDDSIKGWLNIMQPFQLQVYYVLFSAAVGICIVFYILEKVNPVNKDNAHRTSPTSEFMGVSNLFLSVAGCLFLGGDGIRPRTWTGRILTFSIWLFCVVIAATYSGNLTASLSVRREKKPFNSLEEMVELEGWRWGVHPATLTAALLKEAKRADMRKAWSKILEFNKSDPGVLSTIATEHIDRVTKGHYAYISLDPLLFKLSRNDCTFDTITNVLATQHVALALPTDSPLAPEIQRFMFHLFDGGVLKRWEQARYKDKRPKECLHSDSTELKAMYLDDIKGAFAALGFGVAFALSVLFCEHTLRFLSKLKGT